MTEPLDWLLEGEDYIQYRTRRDLLHQPEEHPDVRAARESMLRNPKVQALVAGLQDWPGKVISSHKSAGQPFHRLNFLADLGLTKDDPGMAHIIARILEKQSTQGPFQLSMQIGEAYGGSGEETRAWALCDAPLLLYALSKFGLADHPKVQQAYQYLTGLVRENGWPCVVSPELGSFRGPGRKADPCPFATLAMLKALSQVKELRRGTEAQSGVDALLGLWRNRQVEHPYMFYMGTDYCKLKAPLIWYDILHVLDTLSLFPQAHQTPAFQEMTAVVSAKSDSGGKYSPESVWTWWKDWEFGQKKEPSRWLTLLVERALTRSCSGAV
jgi:hypothetical protein